MSFSKTVKNEIIKKNLYKKETRAFLQGLFLSAGSLIISNKKISFVISNESEDVILNLKQKFVELFGELDIQIVKIVKSFKNKERFEFSIKGDGSEFVLKELGIMRTDEDGNTELSDVCDKSFMKTKDRMTAFLTGVFLGSGSLSVPQESAEKRKYGYHFEMDVISKDQADIVADIFSNFDIFPKIVERGDIFVIYLKNSDVICDVLGLFGASKTVLDLMNQRVNRDMNNATNRRINCISANIDKTVNASVKQMKAIEIIQNTIGLENLPDTLNEAALLRLSNPEASLKDLISIMETKISKGALAQRFDKIIKLSEELGDNDGK